RRCAASARVHAVGALVPTGAVGIATEEARALAAVLTGLARRRLTAGRRAPGQYSLLTERSALAHVDHFPAVAALATSEQGGALAAQLPRRANGRRARRAARPACLLAK